MTGKKVSGASREDLSAKMNEIILKVENMSRTGGEDVSFELAA